MRPLKVLATALALSLLAAPAFAEARPGKPPAAAKAGKQAQSKPDAAKREARILEALKKEGVDDARAKRVLAVMKKYRTEREPVQAEMRKHREALQRLNQSNSTDENAYKAAIDGMDAQRTKLAEIQKRQVTEIRGILKPSEQAKVLRLMNKAKHGKGAKKGSAKKTSHGAA